MALPLGVVGIGLAVGLALAFVVPAVAEGDWAEDAKAAESVATGFVTTCYTIDTQDVDATVTALADVVTENFTTTCLDLMAPSAEEQAALAETQISFGNVVVSSVGTTQVDEDSADVVVAFSFTGTAPDATAAAPLAARGIVHLVKEGDDWRVNDFSEIFPPEATIDAPTEPDAEGEAPQ